MNKKIITVAAIALFATAAVAKVLGGSSDKPAAAAPPAPQVTVAQVLVQDITDSDTFTGRLRAVDTVEIRPRVSGYIQSTGFTEGALVHKGQLLFQIDPRPFQAEVERLNAMQVQAKAQLTLAQGNAARAQRLLDANAIAHEEAERNLTEAETARAQLASVTAALAAARLNLEYSHVTAPISGRVSNALLTTGNLVTNADVLTTVVSVNPVYAYFDVDEQSYLKYAGNTDKAGHGNSVTMGLINEDGYPHNGKVDFVDNQVSPESGTIRVRAVFDNGDGKLRPGLFVRLSLNVGASHTATLIDDRAVGTDLGNKFVYVVDGESKIAYRKIEIGSLVNGLRVIKSGLAAGDVIVVDGLQRVRPGAQVDAKQVAMSTRQQEREAAQAADLQQAAATENKKSGG
jgi:membrane fusion protein, multidrug efflux system